MTPSENARRQDDYEFAILTFSNSYPFHGIEDAMNGAASLPRLMPPIAELLHKTYDSTTGRVWAINDWFFLNVLGPLSERGPL